MSEQAPFDVTVLGAGIMGSCTAYSLARRGLKVLLLEQFDFLHARGSSHGSSRIIRRTHPEDHLANLMTWSNDLWSSAEGEAGYSVMTVTGGLDIAQRDNPMLLGMIDTCKKLSIPHTTLTPTDIRKRYPNLTVPSDFIGVHSPEGGVVNATKAVAMFQSLAAKQTNCELRDKTELIKVEDFDGGKSLALVTSKGTFYSRKLVLCPGPFVNHLTQRLFDVTVPVTTKKITVPYFRNTEPQKFNYNGIKTCVSDHRTLFPYVIFYGHPERGNHMYALPAIEYPDLLKFCWHEGPGIDPLKNDHTPDYGPIHQELTPVLNESKEGPFQFHGLDPKPVIVDTCIYSNTPDKDFILDYLLPEDDRIVLGAGFSGQGFKFAPAIGEVLSDLVEPTVKGPTSRFRPDDIGLRFFSLKRFGTTVAMTSRI